MDGVGWVFDYGDKKMVDYELNQILAFEFRSLEIDIGKNLAYEDSLIEIFDPELALIGKLDKIPIMRSLRILLHAVPDVIRSMMTDTGNTEAKWLLQLFNDSHYNNPENPGSAYSWNAKHSNLIAVASRHIFQKSLTSATGESEMVSIETLNFSQNYLGGIPLKPKLCLRNESGLALNCAGASWVIGAMGHGKIFIEIDWTPVNRKEFDEYIREYIYVQES